MTPWPMPAPDSMTSFMTLVLIPAPDPMMPFMANSTVRAINPGRMMRPCILTLIHLPLIFRLIQHRIGHCAEQRVQSLHVAQQPQMQRTGFNALYVIQMQPLHM